MTSEMPREIWCARDFDGYIRVSEKTHDDYDTKCTTKYHHADKVQGLVEALEDILVAFGDRVTREDEKVWLNSHKALTEWRKENDL